MSPAVSLSPIPAHSGDRARDDWRAARVTPHARQRQRARAIPQAVEDALLDFGTAERTRDGVAWRWTFGKRGWARFCAWMGPAARHMARFRRAYVVTASDDTVVTVAWDWS
ncbi:MAG: hypothetical protein SNJ79_04075 [Sphingomonadaceae bacterium]